DHDCIIYFHVLLYIFFFTDPATTDIPTLSLHDALPISLRGSRDHECVGLDAMGAGPDAARHVGPPYGTARSGDPCSAPRREEGRDRKSTRLNSSHVSISYAVFCLKKKNKQLREEARYRA